MIFVKYNPFVMGKNTMHFGNGQVLDLPDDLHMIAKRISTFAYQTNDYYVIVNALPHYVNKLVAFTKQIEMEKYNESKIKIQGV